MSDTVPGDFQPESRASSEVLEHRQILQDLFEGTPLSVDELLTNLGLYARTSVIVKILFISELYECIRNQPGVIMEFGTWFGQNLALFENMRAIYEPFSSSRRVIGFDTFTGYTSLSETDVPSRTIQPGGYAMSSDYPRHLREVLRFHEQNNVLADTKKHEIVVGDVAETLPRYLAQHPETVVALAYFDMALHDPTLSALRSIARYLVPGSVLMLDEFSVPEYPGETVAVREFLDESGLSLSFSKSRFMPDRTIARVL